MVPCKGWKGLVDKHEQTVLLGIQDLINLLSDCAKSHGLLIQDVNDYNKKGGK